MIVLLRPPIETCATCANCGKPIFRRGRWLHRDTTPAIEINGTALQRAYGSRGCRSASVIEGFGHDDRLDKKSVARPKR